MNLAFGVAFIWMGAAALFIATHGLGSGTPWSAYAALMGKMRGDKEEGVSGDAEQIPGI